MIKVCHLTSVHCWNDIRIFKKQCVSLAKHNYDVSLIAFGAIDQIVENVRIINAGHVFQSRKQRMKKGRKQIEKIAIEQDAQIYHFHDPELIPVGKKLAQQGKIVIYDVHEDVPRQILSKPYLNKFIARIISFFFEQYENKSVKKFSAVCCATPFIQKRFTALHQESVDINNFPLENEIDFSDDMLKTKKNKVCYIGGISEIRGILPLVDAMALCNGITLDLAGDFPEGHFKDKIKSSAGWQYVNELGFINREVAQQVKSESIAGIVSFLPAENHINAQPNKIFEYMASGLPVIGSNFPLWRDIIEGNNCGICVDPSSPQSIADAILCIASDKQKSMLMGKNGIEAVKDKYNWKSEEKKLLTLYSKLLKQPGNE